jgi:hypothetical protein
VYGSSAERLLPYLADAVAKAVGWEVLFTVGWSGMKSPTQQPLLVLSPVLAETMAKSGFTKRHVKEYLFEHARIPAWKFEQYITTYTHFLPEGRKLVDLVNMRKAPRLFGSSDDPARMLPVAGSPDDFLVAVSGDPLRTNAYVFVHNGILGYTTAKKIQTPANWTELLNKARSV